MNPAATEIAAALFGTDAAMVSSTIAPDTDWQDLDPATAAGRRELARRALAALEQAERSVQHPAHYTIRALLFRLGGA